MWGHIERSSNKMVYVRAVTDIADDDSQLDSVCFPVSAIRGFQFSSGTVCIVRFETPFQYVPADNSDMDAVMLTISTGSHKAFITNLANEIAFGDSFLITLGDDVTSEYLDGVTNVLAVSADIGAD